MRHTSLLAAGLVAAAVVGGGAIVAYKAAGAGTKHVLRVLNTSPATITVRLRATGDGADPGARGDLRLLGRDEDLLITFRAGDRLLLEEASAVVDGSFDDPFELRLAPRHELVTAIAGDEGVEYVVAGADPGR